MKSRDLCRDLLFIATILGLIAATSATAATTIHTTDSFGYGANVGWINFRGDGDSGVVSGEYYSDGYAYSVNIGWINLGSGEPANGYAYQNNSKSDYGVNLTDVTNTVVGWEAKLRGFAYGANVGWIQFEDQGDPLVDLSTGMLRGYAYGANIGWIALDGTDIAVRTTLFFAADNDEDGISDPWELFQAGNLEDLGDGDADGDGASDRREFLADTKPFSAEDVLEITDFTPPRQIDGTDIFFTTLTWNSKPTRRYAIEVNPDLVSLWATFMKNIPSPGDSITRTIKEDGADRRFYQIRALLPLEP